MKIQFAVDWDCYGFVWLFRGHIRTLAAALKTGDKKPAPFGAGF